MARKWGHFPIFRLFSPYFFGEAFSSILLCFPFFGPEAGNLFCSKLNPKSQEFPSNCFGGSNRAFGSVPQKQIKGKEPPKVHVNFGGDTLEKPQPKHEARGRGILTKHTTTPPLGPWDLSGPLRLRVQSRSRTRLRIAASIAFVFRSCFKGVLDTKAPLSRG